MQFSLQSFPLNSCTVHHPCMRLLWNSCELDWTPQSTDGLFLEFLEAYRLRPGANVCIPPHRSVAHLIQQLMWRKALGPRCSLLQIVRESGGGVGGEPYLMQPRFCWKQVKTPTLPLSGEEKYAFVRLDVTKDQPARGPSWISSWDFTEKNKLIWKKKRWRWATRGPLSLWYQSSVTGLTFLPWGIIKNSPAASFPPWQRRPHTQMFLN